MEQPSPITHGFNPETKEWESEEGKEEYRKKVSEFALYISSNQKRVKLTHGTARVNKNCSNETIESLNKLSVLAFKNIKP